MRGASHINADGRNFRCYPLQIQDINDDEIEIIELTNLYSSDTDYTRETDEEDVVRSQMNNSIPKCINFTEIISNIKQFIFEPASKNTRFRCLIYRDRRGIDKGFFPTYRMHLDSNLGESQFLLAARRRKKSTSSNYLITDNMFDLRRHSPSFVGKLRSNYLGTNYVVFDYRMGNHSTITEFESKSKGCRRELSGISYETDSMSFKRTRKMTVLIPGMDINQRIEFYKYKDCDSLLGCWMKKKMHNLIKLHNRIPFINDAVCSVKLSVKDRVTKASVKNFQLLQDNDVDTIVMQFSKLSKNVFSMEFGYPLCAMQAFGIALSSIDCQITSI